jgi:hypothetical protein
LEVLGREYFLSLEKTDISCEQFREPVQRIRIVYNADPDTAFYANADPDPWF